VQTCSWRDKCGEISVSAAFCQSLGKVPGTKEYDCCRVNREATRESRHAERSNMISDQLGYCSNPAASSSTTPLIVQLAVGHFQHPRADIGSKADITISLSAGGFS
jgi:hypothetical protein